VAVAVVLALFVLVGVLVVEVGAPVVVYFIEE
jgi:hypothetical protein